MVEVRNQNSLFKSHLVHIPNHCPALQRDFLEELKEALLSHMCQLHIHHLEENLPLDRLPLMAAAHHIRLCRRN